MHRSTGHSNALNRRLVRSDLPVELEAYENLDHVDPITRLSVKREPVPEESLKEELADFREEIKSLKKENENKTTS